MKNIMKYKKSPALSMNYTLSNVTYLSSMVLIINLVSKSSCSQLFFARPPHGKKHISRPPLTINKTVIYKNCICMPVPWGHACPSSMVSYSLDGHAPLFEERCLKDTKKGTLLQMDDVVRGGSDTSLRSTLSAWSLRYTLSAWSLRYTLLNPAPLRVN